MPDCSRHGHKGQRRQTPQRHCKNQHQRNCIRFDAHNDFVKPADGSFIDSAAVEPLAETGSLVPPSGAWILYYDTGVTTGSPYRAYTVTLKDDKGLVSPTLETGTSLHEPPLETVNVTRGGQSTGSGTDTDPVLIKGETPAPEAEIEIENTGAGTAVHCTVTEVGMTTSAQYGANPVTVPLNLNEANEKLYKVEYHSTGDGYKPSAVKTKYYKVLKQHTVTFHANGGAYADSTTERTELVPHGTNAAMPVSPNVPMKTGFTVGTWCTDAACTTQWNFAADRVTSDMTLFAKWNPAPGTAYKVEHYQEETSGAGHYPAAAADIESLHGTTGSTITPLQKNYSGFEFDKQEPLIPVIAADGTTVVKVYYKRKTITLTFNLNGGNISGSPTAQTRSGRFGTTFTAPANPVKTGYTFSTWQPAGSAPALSSTFPADNAAYTAQWTAITYKVRFNGNGNDGGSMSDQTFMYDMEQQLSVNAFTKTNYTFKGWATSAGGSKVYDTQQSVKNLTSVQGGTFDLYAVWAQNPKVTFKVENDTGGSLTGACGSQSETASGSAEKYLYVPSGGSVNFTAMPDTGWEVESWTGVTVSPSNSTAATLTSVTSNKTVTVKFKKKVYTVTFSVADGEGKLKGVYGSQNQTAQNGGGTVTLSNVPHGDSVSFTAFPADGWEVDGWTGVTASPSNSTAATLTNVTSDKTVTVKFKPGVFNLSGGADAWKKFKEEAKKPKGSHTIVINGEITATSGENAGEITLGRNLIVKGGSSAVLNANNQSRIFKVENGKALTIENITLKKGNAAEGAGVYIAAGAAFTMHDSSTIVDCSASKGSGVYVGGTFNMKGGALVNQNNDVYLENGKSITVTGALSRKPAALVTPDSYADGRVLATGSDAEKANFTLSPDSGGNKWRYKKTGSEIKFVPATLKVTFTEIKCVAEHDAGSTAEYYWTMKVDGQMISERKDQKNKRWEAEDGATLGLGQKSFTETFKFFPASKTIPVNIEIYEDDNEAGGDDHIGTTKANLTYDYENDQWTWAYDSAWASGPADDLHGNKKKNSSKTIDDGGEETFTEQYRHNDGDTDVTIKIRWKE